MENNLFQEYSKKHVQFYDETFPDFIKLGFCLISDVEKPRIVDLGCGDGRLLFALHQKGFLNDFSEIVGVDLSKDRLERVKEEMTFVNGIVSDASNVKDLQPCLFDYVICSQVIEHIQNDESLVTEIKRLLKSEGVVYVSSVIKQRNALYFYFSNGSFRIDPTHVREYSSIDQFVSLLTNKEFEIINLSTCQIGYPILDLLYRVFAKLGYIEPDAGFFRKHKFLAKLRKLRIPVIGYKTIEVIARKK